jgi:primosomal protein DnaI
MKQMIDKINNSKHTSKLNLTEEQIDDNALVLYQYIIERQHCDKCEDFKNCPLHIKGMRSVLPRNITKEMKYFTPAMAKCNKVYGNYNVNHSNSENIKRIEVKDIIENNERKAIFEHFKKITQDVKEKGYTNEKGLVLQGLFGVGKSFMSYALVNKLNKLGQDVMIIFAPDMARKFKTIKNIEYEISFYKNVDVLMLDDLFAEEGYKWNGVDWYGDILIAILNSRMENNKLTIITTNLTNSQIINKISKGEDSTVKGERIMDRIKKLCNFFYLEGENLRNKED